MQPLSVYLDYRTRPLSLSLSLEFSMDIHNAE